MELVAQVITKIVEKRRSGIWHLSATADISYEDIAKRICLCLGCNTSLVAPRLNPETGDQTASSALYSTLDTTHTSAILGISAPTPHETVDSMINK